MATCDSRFVCCGAEASPSSFRFSPAPALDFCKAEFSVNSILPIDVVTHGFAEVGLSGAPLPLCFRIETSASGHIVDPMTWALLTEVDFSLSMLGGSPGALGAASRGRGSGLPKGCWCGLGYASWCRLLYRGQAPGPSGPAYGRSHSLYAPMDLVTSPLQHLCSREQARACRVLVTR